MAITQQELNQREEQVKKQKEAYDKYVNSPEYSPRNKVNGQYMGQIADKMYNSYWKNMDNLNVLKTEYAKQQSGERFIPHKTEAEKRKEHIIIHTPEKGYKRVLKSQVNEQGYYLPYLQQEAKKRGSKSGFVVIDTGQGFKRVPIQEALEHSKTLTQKQEFIARLLRKQGKRPKVTATKKGDVIIKQGKRKITLTRQGDIFKTPTSAKVKGEFIYSLPKAKQEFFRVTGKEEVKEVMKVKPESKKDERNLIQKIQDKLDFNFESKSKAFIESGVHRETFRGAVVYLGLSTAKGFTNVFLHPVKTAKGLYQMVRHPYMTGWKLGYALEHNFIGTSGQLIGTAGAFKGIGMVSSKFTKVGQAKSILKKTRVEKLPEQQITQSIGLRSVKFSQKGGKIIKVPKVELKQKGAYKSTAYEFEVPTKGATVLRGQGKGIQTTTVQTPKGFQYTTIVRKPLLGTRQIVRIVTNPKGKSIIKVFKGDKFLAKFKTKTTPTLKVTEGQEAVRTYNINRANSKIEVTARLRSREIISTVKGKKVQAGRIDQIVIDKVKVSTKTPYVRKTGKATLDLNKGERGFDIKSLEVKNTKYNLVEGPTKAPNIKVELDPSGLITHTKPATSKLTHTIEGFGSSGKLQNIVRAKAKTPKTPKVKTSQVLKQAFKDYELKTKLDRQLDTIPKLINKYNKAKVKAQTETNFNVPKPKKYIETGEITSITGQEFKLFKEQVDLNAEAINIQRPPVNLKNLNLELHQVPKIDTTTKTANAFLINTKPIQQAKPEIKTKESVKIKTVAIPISSVKSIYNTAQKSQTKTLAKTIQQTKPATKQISQPITKSLSKAETKTATKTVSKQIQQLQTKQITKTTTNPKIDIPITRTPPPPNIPRFSLTPSKDRIKTKSNYEVLIKRRGVFRKVGSFGSLKKAVTIGKRGVDFSSSASFKIKGPQVNRVDSFLGKKFRRSKKDSNIIVEKRRFRISTGGEKREITSIGLMTLRSSKKKKKNLFNIFAR